MSFTEFIVDMFEVLQMYINFLFTLDFVPGVSIGAFFLVASVFTVLTITLWVRR